MVYLAFQVGEFDFAVWGGFAIIWFLAASRNLSLSSLFAKKTCPSQKIFTLQNKDLMKKQTVLNLSCSGHKCPVETGYFRFGLFQQEGELTVLADPSPRFTLSVVCSCVLAFKKATQLNFRYFPINKQLSCERWNREAVSCSWQQGNYGHLQVWYPSAADQVRPIQTAVPSWQPSGSPRNSLALALDSSK